MKVNIQRLKKDFYNIALCGVLGTGGLTRLAFSPEDIAARSYLLKVIQELNLKICMDQIGNILGIRKGLKDLPPVVVGSHIDSVPNGGNFDGVAGIIAGLEVIRMLNDQNISTFRPVAVIIISAEESSRFKVGTLGSKALIGKISTDYMHALRDKKNISLYDAATACRNQFLSIPLNSMPQRFHSYLEMHIEQGPVLENSGCPIGIVTAIAAPTRLLVTVTGEPNHSGATPMCLRKDALAGACEMTLAIERICKDGDGTVGTVGNIDAEPGVMNVIPGIACFKIDIRDINFERKAAVVEKIILELEQIAEKRNLGITIEFFSDEMPVELSKDIIDLLSQKASSKDILFMHLHSGAGHDAMNLASICPTGMIFIRNKGGSHNPKEDASWEDIALGTTILYEAAIQLANQS